MTYRCISKQPDLLGSDVYRADLEDVPNAFLPMVTHSVSKSPRGTSHSVNVRSVNPSIRNVDGIVTSSDQFLMTTKFTSLQHITDDATRAAIYDNHIAFLIASRDTNLAGELPVQPVTF